MDTKFAYWVPNVSGGLVITDWPMKTDWKWPFNKGIAQTAEEVGFEYALAQARFFGSYNAEKQLEALSVANALASHTTDLRLIGAVHPGQWKPGPGWTAPIRRRSVVCEARALATERASSCFSAL